MPHCIKEPINNPNYLLEQTINHKHVWTLQQNVQPAQKQTKERTLTFLHQNTDRISNKIECLNTLLFELKPDFVILTKHGQKIESLQNTRLIGYILTAEYCRKHHQKGGAATFAKESLNHHVDIIDTYNCSTELVCEIAIAKITLGRSHLFLVGVYRTNGNLEASLEILAEALESIPTNQPVLIMGDINIDSLTKKNEILTSHNIHCLDLPPTRITPTSRTSIDCVCTNLEPEKIHVEVINTAISDHTGQLCTIQWNKHIPPPPATERRNMSNRNLLNLKTLLRQQDWTSVFHTNDVEESYNNFNSALSFTINSTCPIIKLKKRTKQAIQTLTDPIAVHLRRQFTEAQDLYNTTGDETDKRNVALLKKEYDLRLKHLR
uniref:Endonuclease/exonuclease/phosphatase domain-containing protein n=1 Tax=Homalodisca liturata TaxID=320908 RepID=A0A1B6IVW6_9HEMI